MAEWLLGLRAVTARPRAFFLGEADRLSHHNPAMGTHGENASVYDSQDFFTLYNLVRQAENDEKLAANCAKFIALLQ